MLATGVLAVAVLLGAPVRAPAAAPPGSGGSAVDITRPRAREPGAAGDDRSGRVRDGMAGLLTGRVQGERLASGDAFDPSEGVAASSVLPVGSVVRVTNLDNGRVTMVQVRDVGARGSDRLIDLSGPAARAIGLTTEGARVRVAPLAVPQADGSMRLGDGSGLSGQQAAPSGSARPRD